MFEEFLEIIQLGDFKLIVFVEERKLRCFEKITSEQNVSPYMRKQTIKKRRKRMMMMQKRQTDKGVEKKEKQ